MSRLTTTTALCVLAVALVAGCSAERGARGAPAVTKGYRLESGLRYAYTMEVPEVWESLRGGAQEGARVGRQGDNFVADIAVAREQAVSASPDQVRERISASLGAAGLVPVRDGAAAAGALRGWMWEFPAQPASPPLPRIEARRVVVLYDPRGYEWILTFSWASEGIYEQYQPAFEHALQTFRPL